MADAVKYEAICPQCGEADIQTNEVVSCSATIKHFALGADGVMEPDYTGFTEVVWESQREADKARPYCCGSCDEDLALEDLLITPVDGLSDRGVWPALLRGACILTGVEGEDADDCTTHAHEGEQDEEDEDRYPICPECQGNVTPDTVPLEYGRVKGRPELVAKPLFPRECPDCGMAFKWEVSK